MHKSTSLTWSISTTLSLVGIILTLLLTLIQSRIWNGPGFQDPLLSFLAPDALVNEAAKNQSSPPSVYFKYGHFFIVAYLLLIISIWRGSYLYKKGLKDGIILAISIAATANVFIYWIGEYLTIYGRGLFSTYVELPALSIAILLFSIFVFRSSQESKKITFTYLYFLVFLVAFLVNALFQYIPYVLVFTLLVITLLLSIQYSSSTPIDWGKQNWKTKLVPLVSLSLLVAAFSLYAFIYYKPTIIAGKPGQAIELHLPEHTGVKVFILNTGFNRMSKALSPGNPIWRPAPVFLIHHPSYGYMLFDCGISKEVALNGQGAMPFPMSFLFESNSSVDKIIDAQLRKYGISTDSIKTIIISHLHEDHTGGLSQFKNVNVVVHTNTLLETTDLAISNASSFTKHAKIIGNTYDLLGDSTLLLIESEGHTKDDLMLLIAADNGPVLLTGDVVVHFDWLHSTDVERLPENPEGAASVRNSIRELVKVNKNLLLFPGHDIPIIPTNRHDVLKLFPENFILKNQANI